MVPKKRIFRKLVLPIGLAVVILLVFILDHICKSKNNYRCAQYTLSEVKSIFSEYHDLFWQIPGIIETEAFWEKGRIYEGDYRPSISSPKDKKMSLFSKSDQQILIDFFEKTKPYMISLDYRTHCRVTYMNEDRTGAFSLIYFYGSSSEDSYPIVTGDGTYAKNWSVPAGHVFKRLDNGWGMYYKEKL